ncbi:chemotaxis protein CheD [bacterium]|nr:chemotaxis protein CheD [bacterium]
MDVFVGVADMKTSDDPEVTLVTHSLGSCMGLSVYDPQSKVGGMLHYMLPESSSPERAKSKPLMYADTAIPLLFKSCYELGAVKRRMVVKVTGGSQILDPTEQFMIGKRNYAALRKILFRNNVLINAEDIGGSVSRTMRLSIATGEVRVKVSGQKYETL